MSGKVYVNRREDCPLGDFYPTPKSLTYLLMKHLPEFQECVDASSPILEPSCGTGAITDVLRDNGAIVIPHDKYTFDAVDFIATPFERYKLIITNPPFSAFDEFVIKAKEVADTVAFIGKVNFMGAQGRSRNGVWDGLRDVMVFNRMVDYRTPTRDDGHFHVGNLVTGWFVWDRYWDEAYARMQVLDVTPWATLGQYKEEGVGTTETAEA